MENASKALLIAGGVLAGILLLTLFSYILLQMKGFASKHYAEMSEHETAEFNQQFLKYEGRDDLSIQDVITIINLAKNNNEKENKPIKINVFVGSENWTNKNPYDLIHDYLETKFKCQNGAVKIDSETLLVNQIKIIK